MYIYIFHGSCFVGSDIAICICQYLYKQYSKVKKVKIESFMKETHCNEKQSYSQSCFSYFELLEKAAVDTKEQQYFLHMVMYTWYINYYIPMLISPQLQIFHNYIVLFFIANVAFCVKSFLYDFVVPLQNNQNMK